MLNSKIVRFIGLHRLLEYNGKYLVAVSGGADSVCLLLLLKELGYQVEAAHCNFHLRGQESQRDEEFVKSLCKKNDVALHIAHYDTLAYAQFHKISIEMAARTLRYRYFEQLRQDLGFSGICVAHHRDDSVETILMNLIRGTGIHGLTGIKPLNGYVVRPLLCASRKEIEQWLREKSQAYVTDSTNLHDDIVRNKLRLNIIPLLHEVMPKASANIMTTAAHLRETALVADAAIEAALQRLVKDNRVALEALLSEPSAESILFAWLEPAGFSSATILQIASRLMHPVTGALWQSATHEVCIDRGCLLLQPREASPKMSPLLIPEPGNYRLADGRCLRFTISDGNTSVSRDPWVATLDASKLALPLTLRRMQTGDRFVPFGMKKGSRLVSDCLTDWKLSVLEKRNQLVLADATGTIVWVVGHRVSELCRVDEQTTLCATLHFTT